MASSRSQRLKLLMGDAELPLRPIVSRDEWEKVSVVDNLPVKTSHTVMNEENVHPDGHNYEDLEIVGISSSSSPDSIIPPTRIFNTTASRRPRRDTSALRDRAEAPDYRSTSVQSAQHPSTFSTSLRPTVGEISAPDLPFCPVKAAEKYPYRYVGGALQEIVASEYFAGGKFWGRQWDLYYIQAPSALGSTTSKPLLLLPAHQFSHFLNAINTTLHTGLTFPTDSDINGFVITFPADDTPRPRYLGHTDSKVSYTNLLTMSLPSPPSAHEIDPPRPSDRSLEAFRRKMELAIAATKNRGVSSKLRKKDERLQKQQSWNRQLKRTQRYLGLRPRSSSLMPPSSSPTMADSSHPAFPPLDISLPPPYPSDEAPVLIAVDVESFEHNHSLITEIGISTLDTLLLSRLAPGATGEGWHKAIKTRHFRVKEYVHLNNRDFVDGCAERFEFGESEFVSIKDAAAVVENCFRSACTTSTAMTAAAGTGKHGTKLGVQVGKKFPERRLILVGHDTQVDISYLRALGYNPLDNPCLLETLDTSALYRTFKRESNPRGLGYILYELGLIGWHLHNAGNDAAYTLHALIGISLKAILGDTVGKVDRQERIKRAEGEARAKVEDDLEGWSSSGEKSDGGSPDKTVEKVDKGKAKEERARLQKEEALAKIVLEKAASRVTFKGTNTAGPSGSGRQ